MTIDTGATPTDEPKFDLDISIVETDAGLAELMRLTDDSCGSTCQEDDGLTGPHRTAALRGSSDVSGTRLFPEGRATLLRCRSG
ncbi:MAG: FxLD family lanthipeptide [Pseudonocardia sp.]